MLNLVKGKTYDFIFWADAPGNGYYTFDPANQTVKVNYDNATANDEKRDAFFQAVKGLAVNEAVSQTVELYRPFGQLNVGTDDVDAAKAGGLTVSSSTVTVDNVYTSLNLFTGVAADPQSVTFTGAPQFDYEFYIDDQPFQYLQMDYLLTGATPDATTITTAQKELVNVDIAINDGTKDVNTFTVSQVPVQRNYRTNIYGSLLTSKVDFNVVIKPEFETPDYDVMYPTVEVTTAEDLATQLTKGSQKVVVPASATLDLSQVNNGAEIKLAPNTNLHVEGTVNTARSQLAVYDGEVTVSGTGTIQSVGLDGTTGNRPLNVYNGATLNVKDVTVKSEQTNAGSTIYSNQGNLNLDNVTVDSHFYGVNASGGTFTANSSVIKSDANNSRGSWAYTVSITNGCKAELKDCTVTGCQGGVSVGGQGSSVDIDGGTYTTELFEGQPGTAYHTLYVFDNGKATVYSGSFSTPDSAYCFASGNNDTGTAFASGIYLYGGKYSNKGVTASTGNLQVVTLPDGYEWKDISDGVYKYEVVKK